MVLIENKLFKLEISDNCVAKSLILKSTGEECLYEETALFSLTQERPYNNEIKLVYPNKRTTFVANRIRRDGNKLFIGFELVAFEAVIELHENDDFVGFNLVDFIVPEDTYGVGTKFIIPAPISKFRMLQLSLTKRVNFGNWLNAVWDKNAAIGVIATSPYAMPDADNNKNSYLLYADATKDVKLLGSGAALVVSPADSFLDCIDKLEEFYNLPKGVKNRRADGIDESIYWTLQLDPSNVDTHIECAKKCGFKKMTIFVGAFVKWETYSYMGDYDFNSLYPNGIEDLKLVLKKIKDAGIVPGIHFLHTHIGLKSRYVTPVADHRLNLTHYFTLAKDVCEQDDVIYVEEDPTGAPLNPDLQVLKWNGELIHYDSYTTEYPYCFKGCKRGYCDTNIKSHSLGTIGGVLDVTEFSATSAYINERTNLQDEIAEKLATIYNAGFEYVYFDGSEGVNAPFAFNVAYAQYRVYKKLKNEPILCEGAAKSHFGWHMLSGGNAFDVFPPEVFKQKIVEFPLDAAPKMATNFTRVNFGWWRFNPHVQPDMYEFGTSKAAAYNCAATVMFTIQSLTDNPRADDIFEVLYRWEDVKRKKWLTEHQKELLKNPDCEYILLVNEDGEYELTPYYQIKNAAKENDCISAFYFERKGKVYVVCWHKSGSGKLKLPLYTEDFTYEEQLGGNTVETQNASDHIIIPVSKRRYFSTTASKEAVISAFENAEVLE